MRNITVAALAKIAEKTGTMPVVFVDIQWSSGAPYVRYSSLPNVPGATPSLVRIDNIDTGVNISGSSFGVSCGITLGETDGDLKAILDRNDVHKCWCRVFHWYPDLAITDAFEIFRGQISSPVEWSEGSRQLSFTILDQIYSRDVGFSLEQGQFNYVSDEVVGQSWPVCFGDVLNVPAVKAIDVAKATSIDVFGVPDPTLSLKRFQIETDLQNYERAYYYYTGIIYNLQSTITPYYIVRQTITLTNFTLSGLLAGNFISFTLKYKGVETDLIISGDDAQIKKAIQDIAPEWEVTISRTGNTKVITLSFQFSATKYKNRAEALEALKPTAFTLKSTNQIATGKTKPSGITLKPTKVAVDGTDIDYTSYETMIYTRAKEIQQEYANAIVAEDALKQDIEDLSGDADKVNKLHDQVVRQWEADGDADVTARLNAAKLLKNNVLTALLAKTRALTLKTYDKERLEIDSHNLKYVFESIKSLKIKIISLFDAYVRLRKRYDTLLRIIAQQEDILTLSGKVQDSNRFSQSTDLDTIINGVKVRGQFVNGEFTIQDLLPNYENVVIAPRESEDLDYFWIDDDTIDLRSKYCKIQNDRIIFVNEQVGHRCRFDLVQRKSNIRSSPDDFVFAGLNEGQIKSAFSESLVGTETLGQIIAIANSIPKDINKGIYSRLRGGLYTQVLTTFMPGHAFADVAISGKYQLKYNGQVTDFIDCSAGENEVKAALVAGTELKASDITVLAFAINRAEAEKDYAKAYAAGIFADSAFTAQADIVEFHIIFNIAATSTKPIPMYPIEVVTERPVDAMDNDIGLKSAFFLQGEKIYPDVYIKSSGAHEYTIKKIISKIEAAVEASKHSTELKAIKTKIKTAIDTILAEMQGAGSADEIKAQRDIIEVQQGKYETLLGFVDIPAQVIADAYKLISDSEQKLLFSLELLHFLAWRHSITPITAYFPDPHSEYVVVGTDITSIVAASPVILFPWLQSYKVGNTDTLMENIDTLPRSEAFIIQPGTEIALAGDYQQVYVCNIHASTIRSVRGYRTIDGIKKLLPIPSEYYTKDEADDYGRFTLTSITLKKPLTEYRNENWDDGLFVSLTSSVGPNPMDVIVWILNNFSNLTIDSATYTDLHAKLTNYPTHFALLAAKDALTLVKDIAYQARCSCFIKHDNVFMKYLPEQGTPVFTFNESNIDFKSLTLAYSDSDSITTKYVALWNYDYSRIDDPLKVILRYNVKRFNENKEEVDYYTLTNKGLVEKSATFWLIRKSNMWKLARFKGFLDSLNVEPFDTVTLTFDGNYFSNSSIDGIVQSANYNANDKSMTFEIWLPVRAGEMTPYLFAWPANLSATNEYPLAQDIIDGNAGDPFSDTVPNNISYNPFNVNPTNIRPKDYGDITPTDLTDTLPVGILDGIAETAQLTPIPVNFEPKIEDDKAANAQPVEVAGNGGAFTGEAKVIDDGFAGAREAAQRAALELNPTRIVTIVSKNDDKSDSTKGEDIVDPTGAPIDDLLKDVDIVTSWYNVNDSNGIVFPVLMTQLHPEDRIPAGTKIVAVYSNAKGFWSGIIPVHINDSSEVNPVS